MLLPDGYQYAKNIRFMNEKLCVPQGMKLGWPYCTSARQGDKILGFHIINSDMSQDKSLHIHTLHKIQARGWIMSLQMITNVLTLDH